MYTLKPGYLISVKTELRGGIQYLREDIRKEELPNGAEEQEWKTIKKIEDSEEFKKATLLRAKVASMISSKCKLTPFGLICSEEDLPIVEKAAELGELMIEEFNATAKHTIIRLNFLPALITSDEETAARNIAKQMRALAADMKNAVRQGDVEAIREAAKKAAMMRDLLGEEERTRVSLAVKEARDAARLITKEVIKNKEKIEKVLPKIKLGAISKMRFAFMDTEAPKDDGKPKDKMPTGQRKRMATVEVAE